MFDCEKCNDTGYIETEKGNMSYATPCICNMRRVKKLLFGEYFVDKTIENYEGRTPSMAEAKKIIIKDPFKSFFIYGNVGLGKTHLLAAIYELYHVDCRYMKTKVVNETALMQEINEKKYFDLSDRTTIIIDDIGKVKMAAWEIQNLYDFYNDIYRREIVLVMSSNYSLPEIAEIYGGAITRRIEERCEILHIKGE